MTWLRQHHVLVASQCPGATGPKQTEDTQSDGVIATLVPGWALSAASLQAPGTVPASYMSLGLLSKTFAMAAQLACFLPLKWG